MARNRVESQGAPDQGNECPWYSRAYDKAPDRLIRDTEGAAILGCSKATWWRRVADGTIPRPIKLHGASRWPLSEVLDVIERAKAARCAASDGGQK